MNFAQMVANFDTENLLNVLGMSSFSEILGSERVQNDPSFQLSDTPAVFTAVNSVKNPNNKQEKRAVANCSNFDQPTNICLTMDTMGKRIMVYGESNCTRGKQTPEFLRHLNLHSVEKSLEEFNQRNNKSTDIHINTDVNKINQEIAGNGGQMMKEPQFHGTSNLSFVQNSMNGHQQSMFGSNINERQTQNALNNDSNSIPV